MRFGNLKKPEPKLGRIINDGAINQPGLTLLSFGFISISKANKEQNTI
jgi:hypothetical protein